MLPSLLVEDRQVGLINGIDPVFTILWEKFGYAD
jgi:hypothetical protein